MEPYVREFEIERNDIGNAGTVASLTKRELKKRGFSREFVKQITIGVYEAEINVVIHSYELSTKCFSSNFGKATVEINDEYIEITFNDVGPGIPSIDNAMTEGFSTASKYAIENGFGAGMGLPNIKAVSDEMDLTSSEDGTNLRIRFYVKDNSRVN